jgi:CheY-like chemotaxis protein
MNWSVLNPAAAAKKKRVLLVDTSRTKRDLRSETMRKLGVDVDCAADISEARCWWRADLYDLVLINVEESAPRNRFCDDMRSATPSQHIMFLVGKPEYLANTPLAGTELPAPDPDPALWSDVKAALAADVMGAGAQRWGIMEACRRISAVRSVSEARSRALRNRPAPVRDSEISQAKRMDEPEILAQTILAQTDFAQKIMEKAQ